MNPDPTAAGFAGKPEQRHIIPLQATIREALQALNHLSGESMTLFVVEENGVMLGTVTDGDIRRGLIRGHSPEDKVIHVMNPDFLYGCDGVDICMAIAEGRRRHIDLLPVLHEGKLTATIDLKAVKTILPADAVLMAGGRGERLRPLTDTVPKPLLPVGGKAIIDYNVDELEACGVENIFITVNYLAEAIEHHFRNRRGRSRVECIREPRRLGTMGSIALIEGLSKDDVILMNSDLLTTMDFEGLYLHHRRHDADLTVAAVPYSVSVPFAIMHLEGSRINGLEEKPTFNYFANAGVYIMRRELISRITPGEYLDTPDFISGLISDGALVESFPIDGTWVDIGSPDDYRHANELMRRARGKR